MDWENFGIIYLVGVLVFGFKAHTVCTNPWRCSLFGILWPYYVVKFILKS